MVTTRNLQKHGLWLSHMHRSEQLRYFVEPKLKSPVGTVGTKGFKDAYMEEKVIE